MKTLARPYGPHPEALTQDQNLGKFPTSRCLSFLELLSLIVWYMIGVNDRRRIKPNKGILYFLKKINDVKGIVNDFTILLVLSIMMKNYVACSKKH